MDDLPDVKQTRAKQIRPPVEAAIQLIVTQAVSIAEAAESVGMKGRSLAVALRRPHIKARVADVRRAWLDSETAKARLSIAHLAVHAASEDVRHKAARTLLEMAGELGAHRRDDRPPAGGVLVQIVAAPAEPERLTVVSSSGVIEAPPFALPRREEEA